MSSILDRLPYADIKGNVLVSGEELVVLPHQPFRLELRDGIAIYPANLPIPRPRLPLIGLRAIDENGLRATINGNKRTVSLSSP